MIGNVWNHFVLFLWKGKGNGRRRNICQKRLSERLDIRLDINKICEGFINIRERIRKSKRNFELELAQNIKSNSKSFYAYVRSKQNVRDKVGPLEDNAGDIITGGFLMAEELNMHFSSVFTREDTS